MLRLIYSLPLQYYAFSGLFNFLTALVISFIAFITNKKSNTHKVLSAFSLSVAYWSLLYFIWLVTQNKELAEFYLRSCMIGVLFMPSLFIHFVVLFLNRKVNRKFIIFNYVLSIVFTLTVYTPLYAKDIGKHLIFPYWLHPGPVFHFALLHFGVVVLYSFYLMWGAIKKERGIFRNQILYVFVGTAIGYISGVTNFFSWYRIPIPPFLNIFVSMYVVMVAIAIIRFRLLDINIVITKGLVYVGILALVAGTSLGFMFWSDRIFSRMPDYNPILSHLLIFLLMTTALIFFLPKIKTKAEKAVEKALFKDKYAYQSTLREVSQKVIAIFELDKLLDYVVAKVKDTLGVNKASLILLEEGKEGYTIKASSGLAEGAAQGIKFRKDEGLVSWWENSGRGSAERVVGWRDSESGALVKEEVERVLFSPRFRQIRRQMEIMGSEVSIPLLIKGNLLGILNLGRKLSGDMYSHEDLVLLSTLVNQAALAIQNALYLEELKQTYSHLMESEKLVAMGQMLNSMGHEIGNIMGKISLPAQMFQMGEYKTEEKRREAADRMVKNINTLHSITRDIKGYKDKAGADKVELMDIKEVIDKAISLNKERLASANIEVIKEIDLNIPKIEAKPTMPDIFLHLIVNAYYAMTDFKKGGTLTIKAMLLEGGQFVEVMMSDTGGDLLEKMKRGKSSEGELFAERAKLGGLNLFLARLIVSDHKGSFEIESNQGIGTTFVVKLPISQR